MPYAKMRYAEFRAMNTNVLMAAEGEPEQVSEGFRQAEELVRAHERRFTRFSDDSELSSLNRAAGSWFQASPEMFEVVRLAEHSYEKTGRLFDPGVLTALESAGYDRTMDEVRALSARGAVVGGGAALTRNVMDAGLNTPLVSFADVQTDAGRRAIWLPAGLRIDLGGIAKGWIAEQAARLLSRFASAALVDAGGDIHAVGRPGGSQGWIIALEDPFDSSKDKTVFSMGPGGVATSTITKRRWQKDGQEFHHLIDPRTGLPAQAFWVSVTAIAPHTAQAEVLAKALLIAGPEGARDLLRQHPGAMFLAVDIHGRLWGTENSREVINNGNFE